MSFINVILLFFLVFVSCCYKISGENEDNILVNTTTGLVKGYSSTFGDTKYVSYRGIPFAEPPVGKLRFKPPVPKTRWDDVFDAKDVGHSCMQSGLPSYETMDEDCLTLSVYVPDIERTVALPVYFFIHGGELQMGNYHLLGPQYFMEKDVIVVMTHYRLGSLGFLSLNIPEATGNNGIKDTHLALKWVQQNIAEFGGDPSKVTVGGFSAGSALANYLMLTEKSDGLFQRVILESGAALSNRFSPEPVNSAKLLADYLCDNLTDARTIYDCLIDQNASDIIDAQTKMATNDKRLGFTSLTPFMPVIEIESDHRVIKEKPINSFRNGIAQNVPVLVGGNCKEGYKMISRIQNWTHIDLLNEDPTRYVPMDMYKLIDIENVRFANAIKQFYFNGGNITNDALDDYFNLITDTQYAYPTYAWLALHKRHKNSSDVFYYDFCFDGQLSIEKVLSNISYPGSTHGDQVGYLFLDEIRWRIPEELDVESRNMRKWMISMWTNFIKFGNPTPSDFEIRWRPTEFPQMNHLHIDKDLKM